MALCVLSAQAGMLYHLPFQDSTGNATLANYGTVGGNATVTTTNYTNNTPPLVGAQYAHTVAGFANVATLPGGTGMLTLTNSGDQITGMAYVFLDAYQTVNGIMNKQGTGNIDGWSLAIRDSGRLTFVTGAGTTIQAQAPVASAIPTGTWVHVAFTFKVMGGDASALKLYINGTNVSHNGAASIGTTIPAHVNRAPIVGCRNLAEAWHLKGSIDEVRLYDEILTEQQIRDIMIPPLLGTLITIQ